MKELTCFKAYDIRGQLGSELDNEIAYRIGRSYGQFLKSENDADKTVVVGGDVRLTSEALKQALANGLMDAGINVIDIGVTGTKKCILQPSTLVLMVVLKLPQVITQWITMV